MIHYARRLLAAVPLAVLPSVARDISVAPPRVDGYVITMSGTSDMMGSSVPMTLTIKAAANKVRIEMDMSAMMGANAGAEMMSGAFMLPQEDGRMAMILPNMQNPLGGGMGMGMIMDMQSMTGAMRDLGVSMQITDMKVNLENLGAGETILGRKTTKYRLTQTYQMGGKPYDGVSEIWTTADMRDAEAGLKKFQVTFGMNFVGAATSNEVKAELQAKTPPGFAMRTVVKMTTPEGTTNMKLEVTKAEKATFDAKEFEVPAGIQLMDMGQMMKRGN
jgi:hypothetical protein